jgi:hypothetical protein
MSCTRTTSRRMVLGLITLAVACSSLTDAADPLTGDTLEARFASGVTFLTMRTDPEVFMSALFEGRVLVDLAGCLRLDSDDRHTVVWPRGYGFDTAGGTIRILDATGVVVGRAGDDFRLAGGEVTSLHDGLGFTAADRALASAHCPGRYWIAAPQ